MAFVWWNDQNVKFWHDFDVLLTQLQSIELVNNWWYIHSANVKSGLHGSGLQQKFPEWNCEPLRVKKWSNLTLQKIDHQIARLPLLVNSISAAINMPVWANQGSKIDCGHQNIDWTGKNNQTKRFLKMITIWARINENLMGFEMISKWEHTKWLRWCTHVSVSHYPCQKLFWRR